MDISYRKFTPSDTDALLALSTAWANERCTIGVIPDLRESIIDGADNIRFVACEGDIIIGYVTAEIIRNGKVCVFPRGDAYLCVNELYIARAYRNLGIGEKLLKTVEAEASNAGIYSFMVSSAARDSESIHRFYSKCGYGVWSTDFCKRTATQTHTYPFGYFGYYRFVVIFALMNRKFLYSRRFDRETWETPGGHIEPGESPEFAARRELWEETGAVEFDLRPGFDYSVHTATDFSEGQVFIAEVYKLDPLPGFEMAEVTESETYPERLTYPDILPVLFERVINPDKPAFDIVPVTQLNRAAVTDFIVRHWHSDKMLIRGEVIDMTAIDGFALFERGELTGLATYVIRGGACEVVSLDSIYGGRGVGRALLDRIKIAAKTTGCDKLRLLTTNDNTEAIEFYQRYGFELAGVNLGAIDREREAKPEIPLIGRHGIPIKHEIDFYINL